MTRWSTAQQTSAIYSQLFLISLSLKRIADLIGPLRSESSHPNDGLRPATFVVEAQRDEKETFKTEPPSAKKKKRKMRQQELFPDASAVKPKRGRSNAGRRKPVNFEGREPMDKEKACGEEGTLDQGFGRLEVDESA